MIEISSFAVGLTLSHSQTQHDRTNAIILVGLLERGSTASVLTSGLFLEITLAKTFW